jgi:drug/metabolite transporter (DMT)-like permease
MDIMNVLCGTLFLLCGCYFIVRRNQYNRKGAILCMLGGMFLVAGMSLLIYPVIPDESMEEVKKSASNYLKAALQ